MELNQFDEKLIISIQSSEKELKNYYSSILDKIEKGQFIKAKELFDNYYEISRQKLLMRSHEDYIKVMGADMEGQLPIFQLLQDLRQSKFAFLSSRFYPETVQKAFAIKDMVIGYYENSNQIPDRQTQNDDSQSQVRYLVQPGALRKAIQLLLFKDQQQLMALKVHIYTKSQFRQEAQNLRMRYLPDPLFAINSSIFRISQDNHDMVLLKAFRQWQSGNRQKAIAILQNALKKKTQVPNSEKYLQLTLKLGRYLKDFGFGVGRVMDCYKKALKLAHYDKASIRREMQVVLKFFAQQEGLLAHTSMLEYFDRQISTINAQFSSNIFMTSERIQQLTELLIEKAHYLKDSGQIQLAKMTYLKAIESQSHQIQFKRSLLMKQHAYFLLGLQLEQQAIESFKKSQQLFYSPKDVERFVNYIRSRRIVSEQEKFKLKLRITDYYKNVPFHLLFKSNNNQQRIQFLQRCLQVQELTYMRGDWYRQLAQCYRLAEGNNEVKIIQNLDLAFLACYGKERTAVYYEKKILLKEFAANNPDLVYHLPLLDYIDANIKAEQDEIQFNKNSSLNKSLKASLIDKLIEKAYLLKDLGQITQSIQTYERSIQKIDPEQNYSRQTSYESLARFCISINRLDEAWIFVERAKTHLRGIFIRNGNKNLLVQMMSSKRQKGQEIQNFKLIQDYLTPKWCIYQHKDEYQLMFYMKQKNYLQAILILRQMIRHFEEQVSTKKSQDVYVSNRHKYGSYSFYIDYLFDFYMCLAKLLKKTDQNNVEVLWVFDNAHKIMQDSNFRFHAEKELQISTICRSLEANQRKPELMRYLNEMATNPKVDPADIITQKVYCCLMMKDYQNVLRYYDELLSNFDHSKNSLFTKSKILIKQAYIYKHINQTKQAVERIEKAVELHERNITEKYKFLWELGRCEQADNLIERSKHKQILLMQKGRLLQKYVKELNSKKQFVQSAQIARKNQLIQQSIEAFEKALIFSRDYYSIQMILEEQAFSYSLRSEQPESISNKQNELLKKLGYYTEYSRLDNILNIKFDNILYSKKVKKFGIPDSFITISKDVFDSKLKQKLFNPYLISQNRYQKLEYPFSYYHIEGKKFRQWKDEFISSMMKKTEDFSINSMLNQVETNYQSHDSSKFGLAFMEKIIQEILARFWSLKKYKEAFMAFRSLVFLNRQYAAFSQGNQLHQILRKCYEIIYNFQHQHYQEAFDGVIELKKNTSDVFQALISMSLYKASNLGLIIQKIYILCIWHMGDYQKASRLLTELIFTTGKFIEYINPKRFRKITASDYSQDIINKLQNPHTYVALVKYNSLMYSQKRGDYKQCLRKSEEFELLQTGKISDVSFHINYARYFYNLGEELYYADDVGFVEPFCLFMKKCVSIWGKYPEQKDKVAELGEKNLRAERILKELFQDYMRDIEFSIVKFRDLCYASRGQDINFETMKKYMTTIDQKFLICIKIVNHNVISEIGRTESIQRYWSSICKVIYKDILKKDVNACYKDMKSALEDVRRTLREKTVITRDCLTEDIISPQRTYYEQEIQAIIDDKIQRSLRAIEETKTHLQALIQRSEIQEDQNKNIYQRLGDVEDDLEKVKLIDVEKLVRDILNENQTERERNPFFTDMLNSLKENLQSKVSYTELEAKFTQVYNQIKQEIISRPNQSKQTISREFSRVSTIIEGFRNLPCPQGFEKDELLNKIYGQNRNSEDGKRFISIMQQVLINAENRERNTDEIQAKLTNLESKIENKMNVFNLNQNFTELSEMIDWRVSLVSRENMQTVIANTSMHNKFQMVRVREELQEAIERNFSHITRVMEEDRISQKALISALERSMKQVKVQVSVIERQFSIIQQLEKTVSQNKKEMLALLNKMSNIEKKLGNKDYSDYVGMRQRINEGYVADYDQLTQVGVNNPEKMKEIRPQLSLVKHKLSQLPLIKNNSAAPHTNRHQRLNSVSNFRVISANKSRTSAVQNINTESPIDANNASNLGLRIPKPTTTELNKDQINASRVNQSKSFIYDQNSISILDLPLNQSKEFQQVTFLPQLNTKVRPRSNVRAKLTSENVKRNLVKKSETKRQDFEEFPEAEQARMTDLINKQNNVSNTSNIVPKFDQEQILFADEKTQVVIKKKKIS